MIAGIGVDIVRTARIAQALERHGERFARRVLAPAEWPDFIAAPSPASFLAKRFAAKEAFGKALGTGVRAPATLRAIRIARDALGKPNLQFDAPLVAWLAGQGVDRFHLSISDETDAAVAMVVLESTGSR